MIFKKMLSVILIMFVIASIPLKAQTMSVGLSVGTSKFQWYKDSWENHYPVFSLGYGDYYNPMMIEGLVEFNIFRGFRIRGAFAYGWKGSGSEMNQPGKIIGFTDQYGFHEEFQVLEYDHEINTLVKGWQAQLALLYAVSLDNAGRFIVYPGIGFGYYNFGYTGDFSLTTEQYDPAGNETYTARGKFAEAMLSGFAQFFIAGMEVKLTGRFSVFFEFSKLGFHMLIQENNMDFTIFEDNSGDGNFTEAYRTTYSTEKESYHTNSGLVEAAIKFGFKIGFN